MDQLIVGAAHDADIRIDDDYVSSHHAELTRIRDGQTYRVYVTDLGSLNGTWVNSRRIRGVKAELFPGDLLRFGHTERRLPSELWRVPDRFEG